MSLFDGLPQEWKDVLGTALSKSDEIDRFYQDEIENDKIVYPPEDLVFRALKAVLPKEVKVVLLGQDPYHGAGQACGLCFGVSQGIKAPPSLRNIFKELDSDIGPQERLGNHPSRWAEQGVLLLNSVLTVRQGEPGSHSGRVWEYFTDGVIKAVSDGHEGVVFLLWGAYAQKKADLIDENKHLVLKAAHPSPFSAYRGFLGSKPFSQCNAYLKDHAKNEIKW